MRTVSLTRILCALVLSVTVLPVNASDVSYKVYVTNQVIADQPTNKPVSNFDCADRIYLVIEATGLSQGKHELEVKWFNPVGEQQEITRYEFDGYPFSRVWAWLQLNGPPGAVIGQVFDPSFGMENFIGEWRAEAAVSKNKMDITKFNVLC